MATSVLHGSVAEPKVALRKFTIGEYHKLGEAGILRPNDRVELIDGLLIQMAPIGPEHQFILETLNEIFGMQKKGRFKVGPGRPIPIPDFNEPQPDSGQSHQSISAKPKKEVPRKPLQGRVDRSTNVSGCFGPTRRYFFSFSAVAGNAKEAFQFAVTKLSDSNRAVFSDTFNPASLK